MTETTRDRITVRANGRDLVGWLESTVERSLESIAGTFSIPISLVPGEQPQIKRQDVVQVLIGSRVVITGRVLQAEPGYRRGDCWMRVSGRDHTGDLVHCSAIYRGGHWTKAKLDRIVRDLAEPFGVGVVADVPLGDALTDFKLNHGESVVDAISRAARLRGVLVTRDDAGRVLLTRAGRTRAPAAIRRGQNVISMESVGTDERRHAEYIVYAQHRGGLANFDAVRERRATARDPDMAGRYLPLIINADGNTTQAELQALVDHTARVRRGHAYGLRYVVEGWTVNGEPWPLNARVPIHDDIAGIDGQEWLICSVRQTCDLREGDVTELVVRPIESYDTVPLKTSIKHRKADRKGRDGAPLHFVIK